MKRSIFPVFWVLLLLLPWGCSPPAAQTAQDIVARSVAAHGGDRLSEWKTMKIRGTLEMFDGVTFQAAYLLLAEAPGKLRIEEDMTADKGGRIFYEYFLNDGVAWSRRNLLPGKADAAEIERRLNQCYGIAFYGRHADSLEKAADARVEWLEKDPDSGEYKSVDSKPAYVIEATVGKTKTRLYIDKENFCFLEEETGSVKRLFRDFKDFGGAVHPTRILEISQGPRGEQITPYTYTSVEYDVPIEEWLFTEDMPEKKGTE